MAKRKKPKKRQSQWGPAPTIWRILFTHRSKGPTRKNMGKTWRDWTGTTRRMDAEASKILPGGRLKRNRNGTWKFEPPKPTKRTAKQRTADKDARNKRGPGH